MRKFQVLSRVSFFIEMKIVFITYHNWDTRRHAGFHALAEFACRKGCKTVFFSFSRPYYSYFMNDERLNKNVLKKLVRGAYYDLGGHTLVNVTWPTFSVKGRLRRVLPHWLNTWLDTHSFESFSHFSNKWLSGADVFVLESNEAVLLYPLIKKHFPYAKITYRPSDPILDYNSFMAQDEIKVVTGADMNFIVTDEGLELYKNAIPNFEEKCKYTILHNGIYIGDYMKKYSRPSEMIGKNIVTYVGVEPIEWPLVVETAKRLQDVDIYIITPIFVDKTVKETIKDFPNIHYIPGIYHKDVPAWITNSDVIITPLETDFYKRRKSILISAKNLKPIAAKKPLVTYSNNPKLAEYGITTTYDYNSFIDSVNDALTEGSREYTIDLNDYNWEEIGKKFLKILQGL